MNIIKISNIVLTLFITVIYGQKSYASETITILFENYPPKYVLEGGEIKGDYTVIAKKVFKSAQVPFEFSQSNYRRMVRAIIDNQPNTCIAGYAFQEKFHQSALNVGNFAKNPGAILVYLKKNKKQFQKHLTLKSVFSDKDLKGVFLQNVTYRPDLNKQITLNSKSLVFISGGDDAIARMVVRGRVEYTFLSPLQLKFYNKKLEDQDKLEGKTLQGLELEYWNQLICVNSIPETTIQRLRTKLSQLNQESN